MAFVSISRPGGSSGSWLSASYGPDTATTPTMTILDSNSAILYGIWVFGLDLILDSTNLDIGNYIFGSQVGEVAISVGTRI